MELHWTVRYSWEPKRRGNQPMTFPSHKHSLRKRNKEGREGEEGWQFDWFQKKMANRAPIHF